VKEFVCERNTLTLHVSVDEQEVDNDDVCVCDTENVGDFVRDDKWELVCELETDVDNDNNRLDDSVHETVGDIVRVDVAEFDGVEDEVNVEVNDSESVLELERMRDSEQVLEMDKDFVSESDVVNDEERE
jgi:hypothetical protein